MLRMVPCLSRALESFGSGYFITLSARHRLSPLLFMLSSGEGIDELFDDALYGDSLLAVWAFRWLGLEDGSPWSGVDGYPYNILRYLLHEIGG